MSLKTFYQQLHISTIAFFMLISSFCTCMTFAFKYNVVYYITQITTKIAASKKAQFEKNDKSNVFLDILLRQNIFLCYSARTQRQNIKQRHCIYEICISEDLFVTKIIAEHLLFSEKALH